MDEIERVLADHPDLRGMMSWELKAAWEELNRAENRDDPAVKARRHAISTLLFLRRKA